MENNSPFDEIIRNLGHNPTYTDPDESLINFIRPAIQQAVTQYHTVLRQSLEEEVNRIIREFEAATSDIETIIARRIRGRLMEMVQQEVRRVFDETLTSAENGFMGGGFQGSAARQSPATQQAERQEPPAPDYDEIRRQAAQYAERQEAAASYYHEQHSEPATNDERDDPNKGDGGSKVEPPKQPVAPPSFWATVAHNEPPKNEEPAQSEPLQEEDSYREAANAYIETESPTIETNVSKEPTVTTYEESAAVQHEAEEAQEGSFDQPIAESAPQTSMIAVEEPVDLDESDDDVELIDDEVDEAYEGTVRLNVEANGCIREVVRFVRELRQKPQLRLLRLVGNNRDGVDIWLGLREPLHLKKMLPQIEGVSIVSTPLPSNTGKREHYLYVRLASDPRGIGRTKLIDAEPVRREEKVVA